MNKRSEEEVRQNSEQLLYTSESFKGYYSDVIDEYNSLNIKTNVENIWITENPNSFKNKVKRYFSMEEQEGMNLIHYYKVDYASMSPEEKKYRIKYLWFKVKTVYNAVRFMMYIHKVI